MQFLPIGKCGGENAKITPIGKFSSSQFVNPALAFPMAPEPIEVFKALALAHRSLAKLKGRVVAIPNPGILIDTLVLQEAKSSSEIENIVITPDELFQEDLFSEGLESLAAQEVALHRDALKFSFDKLRQTDRPITNATIVGMFQLFKRRIDGFRQTRGTALRSDRSTP